MQQYFPDTEPERKGFEWIFSSLCSFISSTRFLSPHFPLLYQFSQWKIKNGFHFLSSNQNPNSTLYQFSSVQLLSCAQLFVTSWAAAHQASLSFTISLSLLQLKSIESVMPSNHLILCHSLLLLPSIFPSIRVFSNELALDIRRPKYWSVSFSIIPLRSQIFLSSPSSCWVFSVTQVPFVFQLLSHVQLCDPMDCSLPGSSVHGIFQVRILEWVAISFSKRSFSRGASPSRDWTHLACIGKQMNSLPLVHQGNNVMD